MVDVDGHEVPASHVPDDVPEWDDEYLDRVSDRLMFNFDLEKDYRVRGESFDLYGELRMETEKHFFHPSLNYAKHHAEEHLFTRRVDHVSVADLERLVDLGHDLADDVDADEEHYGTDFTFVLVAPEIPEDVRQFVAGFEDRTLIKFGYYGHYEVNLAVVAPDEEDAVASENADVVEAFALWRDLPVREEQSFLQRVVGWLRS
nr:hypothetical protein [Halospeciosus flavus]